MTRGPRPNEPPPDTRAERPRPAFGLRARSVGGARDRRPRLGPDRARDPRLPRRLRRHHGRRHRRDPGPRHGERLRRHGLRRPGRLHIREPRALRRRSPSSTPTGTSFPRLLRRTRFAPTFRTATASSASARPPTPSRTPTSSTASSAPGRRAPEGGQQTVVFGDRVHPATRDLPLMLDRTDQWYTWNDRPTGEVHTVARWHAPDAPAGDGTDVGGTDHPVSWCRDFQGGRSFYTAMGRTAGSYAEDEIQQHLLGAIQWTAGLVRANCKATIASNYEGERLVDASTGDLTHSGESHGLTVAPNGWVIYIGRGDCRTDAQRGEIAGLPGPTPRILDFANPNVGVGCGNVHIFDPAEHDGTVNSGATLAGIIPVYGDRGGGNEINGKIEAGLLGITTAPDFAETGHIYVQYFPTFNPNNPNLPGLADGADRRRTNMSSPAHLALYDRPRDQGARPRIRGRDLRVRVADLCCCHRGGGMGFDSEGNLYVTTGDSNSSQNSSGYSGNNPTPMPAAHPAAGTGDPANNADCGELNFSYQDARRTAGNTNDYNGKMLRFNPIDDIPDGEQPEVGIGTTYDCRPRTRRTGRTCSTAPRAAAASRSPRSTRWACATRRASRSTPRPTSPTPPGSAPTRASPIGSRAPRPTSPPRRSRRPATTAGPIAWATSRASATGLRAASCGPRTRRATSRAAPRARPSQASTTARTSSTTPRTTPASRCSRTRPGPGWTRAPRGRSTSGTAAATRAGQTAAPNSRGRTAPRTTARRRPSSART